MFAIRRRMQWLIRKDKNALTKLTQARMLPAFFNSKRRNLAFEGFGKVLATKKES